MEIGFAGLGKMGSPMVIRLLRGGHRVVAYNRSPEKLKAVEQEGASPALSLQDLAERLNAPRIIWIMVPAGSATGEMVESLASLLKKGDILIDGGNSYYGDSAGRAAKLREKGIFFLDAGTSGGIWGLEKGYCLMVGGDREAFDYAEDIFRALAPPGGYAHVGPSGAGHFAKMVHNGIEYGLMQAYAEGFEILESKKEFSFDLHGMAALWNRGSVIKSWLLELSERIFAAEPHLESVRGYVEDSGEGRWTVAEALQNNVPAPIITYSLIARIASRQSESFSAKVLAALRNEFGGHGMKKK
ncbi:MAG: decarboxylating 6-phosphogluconate dehydrogenase [Candidatus Eremiobacteraeota bacterium]|nr:decarboxylating 6-phosphogluconate dehydrogenase [Candidatus Eremiobacteraeota bacterium]